MGKKKGKMQMWIPTAVMAGLAILLLAAARYKGQEHAVEGVKSAFSMLVHILPLLVFAFIVAGTVPVLLPPEMLARWVGSGSGLRGILIGSVAGGLTPGGPYVSFPIVAGLLRSGAGVGTMVAFITGWSILAVGRLPMDVGILGWKFTLIRLASTFFFPPVAGLIAHALFGGSEVIGPSGPAG
jgi:uncharacterized membrane protein YraQ (UPF0718 family)